MKVLCVCAPRCTDLLPGKVGFVGDLEVRDMLADFSRHLFWSEAHGGDVVGTQRQLALGSLHELYGGAVAVRDVHHGKAGVGTQVALVVTRGESIVEDLNGVVCGVGGKVTAEYMWFMQMEKRYNTCCSSSGRGAD